MNWASQPTAEMPSRPLVPAGRHRTRRPIVATSLVVAGLAVLAIAAMLVPGLVGHRPPAGAFAEGGTPTATTPDPEPPATAAQPPSASAPAPSTVSSTNKAPSPTVAASPSLAAQVFSLTNAERAKNGCAALRLDQSLASAAQKYSADMARTGVFSHTGTDGSDPGDRMRAAGYDTSRGWAENIAWGQSSPSAVMTAWMGSPGHRANILNCSLRALGVGAARNSSGRIYWTQDFGGR
jgi:uncharacterized protein YkwD